MAGRFAIASCPAALNSPEKGKTRIREGKKFVLLSSVPPGSSPAQPLQRDAGLEPGGTKQLFSRLLLFRSSLLSVAFFTTPSRAGGRCGGCRRRRRPAS